MKFLKIAVFFIGLSAFSQGKVGAVDIEYILANMPEMTSVKQQLESYGAQIDVDLNKKVDQYKLVAESYKAGEAEFTLAQKKEKQTELIELEKDIQKFQQNAAPLMEIKRQEYLQPLYSKIGLSLEKIAKAQGYTQVTQATNNIVYLDPNYDLTDSILKDLGITIQQTEVKKEGN